MTTAPFTPEQKKWLEESRKRSVDHAVRRYVVSATIGFVILLGANIFVWQTANSQNTASREAIVDSGKTVSIAGCNRDYRSTQALRSILQTSDDFNQAAAKKGEITQAQADVAHKYYQRFIRSIPLPNCKEAGEILTSESGDVPPAPKPLVPPADVRSSP